MHLVYGVTSNCLGQPTTYRLQNATDYYAFGKTLRSFNGNSKYKFTGKERDKETNLDYVDARNYDSEIGRWNTVDPLKDKMPQWSSYNYALNNPVMMVDDNGEYPIYIYVRSFAPFKTFGGYNWVGDGDTRPFSMKSNYGSRLSQMISYETTTTQRLVSYCGSTSIGLLGPVIGKSEADQDAEFGIGNYFKTHLSGNDDAIVPGMDGTAIEDFQSPDIDVHNSFYITEDKEKNTLMISGEMSGDGFPAAEAYVKDASGTGLFLATSPAQYGPNTGPFYALFGDNNRPMGNYGMKISVDNKGNFMGVQVGDKVVSPDAWNKLFESMNPKTGSATTRL